MGEENATSLFLRSELHLPPCMPSCLQSHLVLFSSLGLDIALYHLAARISVAETGSTSIV